MKNNQSRYWTTWVLLNGLLQSEQVMYSSTNIMRQREEERGGDGTSWSKRRGFIPLQFVLVVYYYQANEEKYELCAFEYHYYFSWWCVCFGLYAIHAVSMSVFTYCWDTWLTSYIYFAERHSWLPYHPFFPPFLSLIVCSSSEIGVPWINTKATV